MGPANIRFGGGVAETSLNPLVAVMMCIAILLMFLLPRRLVIIPLLFATFFIPLGQVVVLGGVHFTVLRIVTIFAMLRCAVSGMCRLPGGFNAVDKFFVYCAFSYSICFVLLYLDSQALINRLGYLLDTLGGYFVLRWLLQDAEDVERVIRMFVIIAAVLAVCMINEKLTQRNVFGLLGGTKLISEERDGRIRANGVFQHSILAGCFGATLLPLFLALSKERRFRTSLLVGIVSCSTMVLTASASTPILAYVAGILGLCFWPLRDHMRVFRRGLSVVLVGLHLVMKAPVWALIARIDLTGSSSGYQRYMLVDNFIRHFSDWWLLGAKTYDAWGWQMWDLSNQYVAYGLTGGLLTLVFFIATISRGFGAVGTARRLVVGKRREEWLIWCLGAALLSHVVAYFGIGYFDQTLVAWYALLAIISTITSSGVSLADVTSAQSEADAESYSLALSENICS